MKLGSFVTMKVKMANWHLTMLKWSSFAYGIVFGVLFAGLLWPFLMEIFGFATLLGIVVLVLWVKAMKRACCDKKKECDGSNVDVQ